MKKINYQDVKAEKAENGASKVNVRWLITKEMGAKNFAMRLFEMDVGGYTPHHQHAWEHEVFILNGRGIVIGGGEEHAFGKGDVIFIPKGEQHQFRNVGDQPVQFLCLIPYTNE